LDIGLLKKLKKLSPRNVLKGKLVHEIVENQIERHNVGQEMNEDEAIKQYSLWVKQYQKKAKETLSEFFNGESLDNDFFNTIRIDGIDHIQTFFNVIWPQVKEFQYLRHEKFDRFHMGEVNVVVKVDYVCKSEDDTIILLDWKTGAYREDLKYDIQLATYVIWAMRNYKTQPKKIKSELVYLNTGNIYPYDFSIDKLDEIKWKIKVNYREMNRTYEIDNFQPNPTKEKCHSCQFASVCPKRFNSKFTMDHNSKVDGSPTQKRIDHFLNLSLN